jgi:hypothetical protein
MPCVKSSTSSFSFLCLHCDRCLLDIIYVRVLKGSPDATVKLLPSDHEVMKS